VSITKAVNQRTNNTDAHQPTIMYLNLIKQCEFTKATSVNS
jgi:hypothetical protein